MSSIHHCMDVKLFIHSLLKDICVISHFEHLQIKLLQTFACRFLHEYTSKAVKGLRFYLTCKLTWVLAEDPRLLGHQQRTLLLTATTVARMSAGLGGGFCTSFLSSNSHRVMGRGLSDTCTHSRFC